MNNRKYIAIDLELEQPKDSIEAADSAINYEKIIQIGAVVFDETNIIEVLCYNIHYPHKLSNFISELTGIKSTDLNNSKFSLEDVIIILKDKREGYKAERNLIQWGNGDSVAIEKELNKSLVDFGFGRSAINVAHLFKIYSWANNISTKGGLRKAFNNLNIPSPVIRFDKNNLGFHNAAFDATVTALIFNKLMEKMKL